jgi:hypothetical protein
MHVSRVKLPLRPHELPNGALLYGIVSDDKGMPRFDRLLVLTESQVNLQSVSDPRSGLALLMKQEGIPFGVWGKSIGSHPQMNG